jgi:hypothetical protein
MKLLGTMIAFLALSVLLLPALTAQDAKKDDAKKDEVKKDEAKKDEKKDPEKKDEAKKDKDEKKDPEKNKGEPKTEKKKEEKLVYGQVLNGKRLARIADNSAREFAIDMPELDPMKVFQFQQWQQQQMLSIAQQTNPQQRAQQMFNYQRDLAMKQANPQTLHNMKPFDLRAVEDIKIRTMFPPVQYDDQGNLIKWTPKKIAEMRAKDKLPGFAAELDALKVGQYVDVYLAKQAPMAKTPLPKKKGVDDDIPAIVRPDVVMIVVIQEAPR